MHNPLYHKTVKSVNFRYYKLVLLTITYRSGKQIISNYFIELKCTSILHKNSIKYESIGFLDHKLLNMHYKLIYDNLVHLPLLLIPGFYL